MEIGGLDRKKDFLIAVRLFRGKTHSLALLGLERGPCGVGLKGFLALPETRSLCEVFVTYCLSSLPLNLEPGKYTSKIFDLGVWCGTISSLIQSLLFNLKTLLRFLFASR